MIPANLIINADDFGLHVRISKAIALCLEEGLINSFSALPFADPFHDDLLKSIVSRHPEARIGVHLSLIDTPAASPGSHGHPGLQEHPNHYRDFLKLYFRGEYPAARIYSEWKAQILALGKYLGGPQRIAHLDSHQHIHVLPGIWPVARALRKEFAIPRLRVPFESLGRSLVYKFPFGPALQGLAWLRRERGGRRLIGFFTSTCFTLEANRAALRQVIRHPDRLFELMVHPALPPGPGAEETPVPGGYTIPKGQEGEIPELRRLGEFLEKNT